MIKRKINDMHADLPMLETQNLH